MIFMHGKKIMFVRGTYLKILGVFLVVFTTLVNVLCSYSIKRFRVIKILSNVLFKCLFLLTNIVLLDPCAVSFSVSWISLSLTVRNVCVQFNIWLILY